MLALFPTGVLVTLTLFTTGVVVGMGTLIKKYFVCMFSPRSTPFPGTGELCSNHLYQTITFVPFIYIFLHRSYLADRSHILLFGVRINHKGYKLGKI